MLFLVAVVIAVTCVELGFWQLRRLHARRAYEAAVTQGMAAPAIDLSSLPDPRAAVFHHVDATGTYDTSHQIVLFGREAANGDPGNHVLTPLVLAGGGAVIVDRGWIPVQDERVPASAEPPPGTTTIEGVVIDSEGGEPRSPGRAPLPAITTKVDLEAIQAALPYRIAPVWITLQRQTPAPASLPVPGPVPTIGDAPPHLSYAFQWFTFATIAMVGYGVLARRELRNTSEPPDVQPAEEMTDARHHT